MQNLDIPERTLGSGASDPEIATIVRAFAEADPDKSRLSRVFRETFDQLYDGQRTGRFRWDQLFKTEKTHFGTLIEINLRRAFADVLSDGEVLDYRVDGIEIDCKYSFKFGGWMVPPEAVGRLLLVATANDEDSEWAVGVVRALPSNLGAGSNRDGKKTLTREARREITWIGFGEALPPNVLLEISPETQSLIYRHKTGQKRLNELFRQVLNRRIGRNTVATVAQQDDYMKRARANGGSRTALAPEGIVIVGGDYESHRAIARQLGGAIPEPGEFVSLQLVPAEDSDPFWAELDGKKWRIGNPAEWNGTRAPSLPSTARL